MDPTTARMMAGAANGAPVLIFYANNYYPQGNTAITLIWDVSNAASVSIDQGIGSVALSGSLSQTANEQRVYTLAAVGLDGVNYNASVTISWSTCQQVIIGYENQCISWWCRDVAVYGTQCN